MRVLLAHPGTQYSGRLAAELARLHVLDTFHTGIAFADGGLGQSFTSALPPRFSRRIANRRIRAVPSARVRLHPWDEIVALLKHRAGFSEQEMLHARNRRFQRRIPDRAFAVDAVVGFDTSSWILAERCERRGLPLILDQSIGHPDSKSRVYEMLRERYPKWSHDAEPRIPEVRKAEEVEHRSARLIVAASTFSRNTLVENGVAPERVRINPYGVDCTRFTSQRGEARSGATRFCFVGSITVRKGVAQLLSVWERLAPRDAELWLIGPAHPSALELLRGHANVVYKGARPHSELPRLLDQCDVFVFPSFFEGFALVILEAMACALPVITTAATAGPDIIRHGEDGWIVDAGDDDALAGAMQLCLADPAKVREAGRAARRTAERFTWESYGDRWLAILEEATRAGHLQ